MRLAAFTRLALAALSAFAPSAFAQQEGALRVAEIAPYDKAVPGQIMELRVEGFAERFMSPPSGDSLKIEITQDGATHPAKVRTAAPVLIRTPPPAQGVATSDPGAGMKTFTSLTFVVPRALHAGEADVVVRYGRSRSAPAKLNIIDRPLRPMVGGTAIVSIAPASLPPPSPNKSAAPALGLRMERGAKRVQLYVRPLSDPSDADASVLVRFKQGGTYHDAVARVVHHERRTENMPNGGVRFSPPRDVLEVDVPELLAPGDVEIEVRLRANGQTGDPVLLPATITDAERAYESPKEAAPRMLAVAPRRVGAGQAVMISVDHRRTLDPEPEKVRVVFEMQDGTRHEVKPEKNSAVIGPERGPDAGVLLVVRAPEGAVGAAKVHVVNPGRAEYAGAASEQATVEIVSETLPPVIAGVAESTRAELAPLRQMYEMRMNAGGPFHSFDPSARYVTIRAEGVDYNPKFLRVRMEQDGRDSVTLGPGDFALFSVNQVIVRVPKSFGAGATRVSVENRGANGYSAPVVKSFELSARD